MLNRKIKIGALLLAVSATSQIRAEAVNLFSLKDPWHSDQGKTVTLAEFAGKKVVFAMAYTSCKGACPIIVKKMEKIEALLKKKKVSAEFIVVSLDPAQDSAEALAAFRMHMAIPTQHWHLLSGTERQTRMLGNLLNIHFAKLPSSGEISHDNKILLFNDKGELLRTIEGLNESLDKLFE